MLAEQEETTIQVLELFVPVDLMVADIDMAIPAVVAVPIFELMKILYMRV